MCCVSIPARRSIIHITAMAPYRDGKIDSDLADQSGKFDSILEGDVSSFRLYGV